MPFKTLITGLICGLVVWAVLDVVQTRALEDIFTDHLQRQLDQAVIEGRIRFDQHLKRQARTIKLVAASNRVADYLSLDPWQGVRSDHIIRYQHVRPDWFPPVSSWRGLMQPGHVLLLDRDGNVQEDYQIARAPLPREFERFDPLLLQQSQEQAYLSMISGVPYLLASGPVYDRDGGRRGYLMLITLLDTAFLRASQNSVPTTGAAVALLGGTERRVLASSSPAALPEGTLLEDVADRFLVTGNSFFDYGASDFRLQFVTLVPRNQVSVINERVLDLERRQRIIAAMAFVIAFTFIMVLVSGRISQLLHRITAFSERALGTPPRDHEHGDQLVQLEDRIGELTQEVLEARETMRRHHENQLRKTEALKSAVLEAALDSIITMDHNGRIIEFNPAAEEAFGYRRKDVLGQDFSELVLPHICRTPFRNNLENHLEDRPTEMMCNRVEIDARRRDGSSFPAELVVTPAKVGDQDIFTAYIQDISRRKENELEIQILANFARENPNPVLRADSRGTIVFANAASEPLLDLWHCRVGETLSGETAEKVSTALNEDRDIESECGDEQRIFSLLVSPMVEYGYANIYGRDITGVRMAEEEAAQHQAELIHVSRLSNMGEMAAGLAHELNQPLSAIVNYARGCTRRMKAGQADNEIIGQALDEITCQAERAGNIIRGLRALVQKREPIRKIVDANQIVREALRFSEYDAKKNGVTISLDLAGMELPVFVDMVQIEQVLLNLLRNALDVLQGIERERRKVWIGSCLREGNVRVTVEDSGPGISEEGADRIFHPFYTEKPHGMGMGLPISKTIIESHNGELWAERGSRGGAAFHMELPMREKGKK